MIAEKREMEDLFFDLECEMERNLCRDLICMDEADERRKHIFRPFYIYIFFHVADEEYSYCRYASALIIAIEC